MGVWVEVVDDVGVEEVEVEVKGLEIDAVGEEGMGRGLDRAMLCIPMSEMRISISV